MIYIISEEKENKIININGNEVNISIKDLDLLINNTPEEIIKSFIEDNELLNYMKATDELKEAILESILKNKEKKGINEIIARQTLPIFSFVKTTINKLQKDYHRICNIKIASKVIISGNKNNIIKCLELAKKIDVKTIIDCKDISLIEYKEIFDKYNTEELKNYDINIHYQEENSSIKPLALYSLSSKIYNIVEEINKYDLSELEQIMYVYDNIKNREYKKENNNIESSRDLDKVIDGEYIVCSGYSNFFNAVLKCLGISASTILSYEKKHQRSIVYVKDKKYNIDGIYVFDPTMDRRKSKDNKEYINKYNGFMIPYYKSHVEFPDNRFKILDLDTEKIISILKDYDEMDKNSNIIDSFLIISNMINNITNEEILDIPLKNISDEELTKKYEEIKSKYKTDYLDIDIFIQVLYKVRRIEYINDIVDDISLWEIKKIVYDNYARINYEKISNEVCLEQYMIYVLKRMEYDSELLKYLNKNEDKIIANNLPEDTSIDKDIMNMRLIKVLKKIDK